MRTNYILVDYQNVQAIDFDVFRRDGVHVIVFIGDNQTKLGSDLVLNMQRLGSRGEFVQISGSGHNALDFHIAFTIGQLSRDEPSAYFHIISKDTGFDPLIKYMNTLKLHVARHELIGDALVLKVSTPKSAADQAAAFEAKLREPKSTRPRTLKTLGNAINAQLGGLLTQAEVESILKVLRSKKVIVVVDTKVTYPGAGQMD